MAILGLWKDNKVSIAEGHWCGGTKAPGERMGAEEWVCVRQGQGRSLGGGFSGKEDEELGWRSSHYKSACGPGLMGGGWGWEWGRAFFLPPFVAWGQFSVTVVSGSRGHSLLVSLSQAHGLLRLNSPGATSIHTFRH